MKNVEIYTGPLCIFCDWAKALLEKKGVPFKEIYIGNDQKKMEEMIKKTNGFKSCSSNFHRWTTHWWQRQTAGFRKKRET